MSQHRIVAVLSGGSEINACALVEELDEAGFTPAIIALRKDSILRTLARKHSFTVLSWPPDDPASCVLTLVEHLKSLGATIERPIPIFATEDGGLRLLLEMRESIEPWGVVGGAQALRMGGLDKAELFTALEQMGCGEIIAPSRVANCVDDALQQVEQFEGDAVIKPSLKPHSMHLRGMPAKAFLSRHYASKEELRAALNHAWPVAREWIIQRRLLNPPGGEIVIWSVRDRQGRTYSMLAHEVWKQPRAGGTGCWVHATGKPSLLAERAHTLLETLGFVGLCEIPFLLDQHGQWRMIELNPRPWLQVGLPYRCGVPMATAAARVLWGEPLPQLPQPRPGDWVNLERLLLAAFSGEQGPRTKALLTAWQAWRRSSAVAVYDSRLPGVRRRWLQRLATMVIQRLFP